MYFSSIIEWLVISTNSLYNVLILYVLLSSIFFFFFFNFEGEPGLPGAVGQNGIPGLKVGTKKTKQNHLRHDFSWDFKLLQFFIFHWFYLDGIFCQ